MKIKIVIVDDHLLIAKALTSIVTHFSQFEVLYEAENGKDLQLKMATKNNLPNIILLDISMPIMNGFETTKWLSETHPEILVMALSMQDDENSIIKMIQNGAKGYLLKNSSPSELEKALNTLIEKGYYYPDWASNIVFNSLNKTTHQETNIYLSEREREFLKYTPTEMSYKEIAEKMFCSPRTVEGYRNSLFEKLNIKTRVGLAVYAIKNGF